MRDEFYGDRKDLWKWTVILNEAGDNRQIVYVAMYRPDEQTKNEFAVRADVREFFRDESKLLSAERKCSRIKRLSNRIIPFLGVYEPRVADLYFAPIKRALELRHDGANFVVFLDPDTGVSDKLGPKHVTPFQLARIWESMLAGDTLLVYQHYARKKVDTWLHEKTGSIAKALNVMSSAITYEKHSGVCFFLMRK